MTTVRADSAAVPLRGSAEANAQKAQQAAVDFEAVFLSQFLQSMGKGLSEDSLFGREPFGSMLVDEYSKVLARSGGVGIASSVQKELLRLQEATQ